MDLTFPAQLLPMSQPTTGIINQDQQLTHMIKAKYQQLKPKFNLKYRFAKSYQPINSVKYAPLKEQFQTMLTSKQEDDKVQLEKYLPLIFGTLEGSSSRIKPMKILSSVFGHDIDKLQIEQMIDENMKESNYSNDKKNSVRQISKLDSLSQLYDTKMIKKHRKSCANVKNYLKALKKFKDSIQKSEDGVYSEQSEQNKNYILFMKQELNLKNIDEFIIVEAQEINQNNQAHQQDGNCDVITPIKRVNVDLMKDQVVTEIKIEKEDAVCSHQKEQMKQEEDQFKQAKQTKSKQQKHSKQGNQQAQSKATRTRRTKQQIEKEREQREREKEQKKKEKEQKQLEKIKEKLEKQRIKQQERLVKQREREAKQKERQAKQKEKEAEKLLKQAERLAKQAERIARQKAKQQQKLAKQKKNNPGKSLFNYFSKKTIESTPSKREIVEQKDQEKPTQSYNFLSSIKNQSFALEECRNEWKFQKMKDENSNFEPFYVNIVSHRSRLQFRNFLVTESRFRQYTQPHEQDEMGKYDDSSVEYEDRCGDNCNDQMSAEQEQGSFNSAIVPDSYKSQDQLSSLQEQNDHVLINIDSGCQWHFSGNHRYAERYTMVCLYDQEPIPLPISQPEQSNELTNSLKCELYKQIHGYYGVKDPLIKRMALIAERVPKSYLDNLIRETTTKKGNQRLVKPEIIEFLNEQKEGFAKQLEEIKEKRDEQNMAQMKGKISEKQRQIQRLILEQAGTYYIIDLLHFLREKGHRMRKRDLMEFIQARRGSQWDDVRRRMRKMLPKEKEKENEKEKIIPFIIKKEEKSQEKDKDGDDPKNHQNGTEMKPEI